MMMMKKYLTKEQSEILINLGLPPIQHCIETWHEGKIERLVRYTIGDLLELLPLQIGTYDSPQRRVIHSNYIAYVGLQSSDAFKDQSELIDNLFDCVITLKTKGIIK